MFSSLCCLFLAIGYLFYFNRLLALLIGYAIRLTWWDEEGGGAWVSLGTRVTCSHRYCNISCLWSRDVSIIASLRENYDQGFQVSWELSVVQSCEVYRHLAILDLEGSRRV